MFVILCGFICAARIHRRNDYKLKKRVLNGSLQSYVCNILHHALFMNILLGSLQPRLKFSG